MSAAASTVLPNGITLVEHELAVPLDHAVPGGEQITLFAREIIAPGGETRPHLVFLQGGPGSEAQRVTFDPTSPDWVDHALRHFRVLQVDQRGTGRSTPIWAGSLAGLDAEAQAARLALHRADAIVADLELLRAALGGARWAVLGQSFGGFCTLHYLCAAPHGLSAAYLTGGVPAVGRPVDDVYAATYATMRERNRLHHERYPADVARLRGLLDLAAAGDLHTPDGAPVGVGRLRSIGNVLGMSYGAERLHHLLELDPRSPAFGHDLAGLMPFAGRNPLYTLLQEACHADGVVTAWAARRTLPDDFAADATLLLGEHVFPHTVTDDPELAPLAAAADLLAHHPWPRLYDEAALAACEVPTAAVLYERDPYVDLALARETVALVPSMRVWTTPHREHDALRSVGEEVVARLFDLVPPPP